MTIITILDSLCPGLQSYEVSLNFDVVDCCKEVSLGFFCIVDVYWEDGE